MKQKIESLLQQALEKLSIQDKLTFPSMFLVSIERPRDPSHGDFSSNQAMVLAKLVSMPPRVLAERLLACIAADDDIDRIEIAVPGFINFTLSLQSIETEYSVWYVARSFGRKSSHLGEVQLHDLESFYKAAKNRFDKEPAFAKRARQQVVLLQSGDLHCHELWTKFIKLSLAHCQEIYNRLGVSLETKDLRAESAYNDFLP